MKAKQFVAIVMVSAATAVGSVWGYGKIVSEKNGVISAVPVNKTTGARFARYDENGSVVPMVDFEKAATKGAPAVVHIRTLTKAKQVSSVPGRDNNPLKDLFGDRFGELFGGRGMQPESQDQRASGSGVIINPDGYIVTNNHVVDGADELTVTLNNKKDFKAKVIGRDPSTDLAVIKIEAKDLPFLSFANSDDVHLGQWVLAIGYPLNLETTVTSGIVSAKSRNIGINNRASKTPVETFIQTDAAVNPGNSGGALVNTDGDVIGINSAIASPTGSYAGYAYAIPSNLVQKVANDIIKYGSSKRAYLGVMFGNDQMTEEDRKKNDIKEGEGVYVMDVAAGSAASEAGIQKGDFVTRVNGTTVNTGTEMVEKISVLHPGDKINVSFMHDGKEKTVSVTLKDSAGAYASMKQQVIDQLGASFEDLDKSTAAKLHVSGGVIVKSLDQGIITEQTRIKEGFIITQVNNTKVNSIEELKQAIKNSGNSCIISGVYPDQPESTYQYALNDLNNSK